ncbi:hypothetical protein PIIN_10514 [Serendipita indica DSM 11827]|uniref:Uncharacterized protein n=1 Tax=Serendipita indica (strain DSM 11827) TaxID=1109443 RepID=G4TYX8_SERID|nr:hypothetical protein PIIN_10514 [Serendipita indica DSM 11827]
MLSHIQRWLHEADPQHPLRVSMKGFTESVLRTIAPYDQVVTGLVSFFNHDVEPIVGRKTYRGPPEGEYLVLRNDTLQHKSPLFLNVGIKQSSEVIIIIRDEVLPSAEEVGRHLEPYASKYVTGCRESRQVIFSWVFEPSVKPIQLPELPAIDADNVALVPRNFSIGIRFFPEFHAYPGRLQVYVRWLQEIWRHSEASKLLVFAPTRTLGSFMRRE